MYASFFFFLIFFFSCFMFFICLGSSISWWNHIFWNVFSVFFSKIICGGSFLILIFVNWNSFVLPFLFHSRFPFLFLFRFQVPFWFDYDFNFDFDFCKLKQFSIWYSSWFLLWIFGFEFWFRLRFWLFGICLFFNCMIVSVFYVLGYLVNFLLTQIFPFLLNFNSIVSCYLNFAASFFSNFLVLGG